MLLERTVEFVWGPVDVFVFMVPEVRAWASKSYCPADI